MAQLRMLESRHNAAGAAMIAGTERQSGDSARGDGGGVPTPPPGTSTPPRKWFAGVFSVVLLMVVASPIVENWRPEPHDDFPLSYFPMISYERPDRQQVTYLVGLDTGGGR